MSETTMTSEERDGMASRGRSAAADPARRKALRSSRLGRLSMLGGMAVGLAGDVVGSAARLGRTQDGVAAELHRRVAKQLLGSLGEMKGLPMKLGQMLSYIEDVIPAEHREVYREALSQLRVRAKPLSLEAIERVIEAELGAPVEELFARFDPEPVAAASIGQVYRAALHDGTEVAVKVQYPGIRKAIESDLKNIDVFVSAMSTILPRVDVETSVEDLTDRLLEECDYRIEARNQEDFRAAWAGDEEVLVPRVVEELSGEHVLVTEYADGIGWPEMLARSGPEERSRIGRIIFRFVFTSLYGQGMLNADPHPGNYVFLPDGRVAFLDFGCVQRYPKEDIEDLRRLYDLVVAGVTGPELHLAVSRAYGLPIDLGSDLWPDVEEYVRLAYDPLIAEQPYRYGRAHTERLTRKTMDLKMEVSKEVLKTGSWSDGQRPGVVFLHRLNFGVASLLAALEATGDWPAIMAQVSRQARP